MMDFWKSLDNLITSREVVIDRPKGSTHPRYPDVVYPLDYGYLKHTSSGDRNEIDVWQGSKKDKKLVGIICTIDMIKSDVEVKLLIGCTDDEIDIVDNFHNNNDYMSGITIKRNW